MARIFYLHWHEQEAAQAVEQLTAAGHDVNFHWSTETQALISEPYPDAFIISLDRLPSHGRAVAEWIWEAKKRQHIPIIFAGGKPDKVEATRKLFPRAAYCESAKVLEKLADVLRQTPAPVTGSLTQSREARPLRKLPRPKVQSGKSSRPVGRK